MDNVYVVEYEPTCKLKVPCDITTRGKISTIYELYENRIKGYEGREQKRKQIN